MSPELEHRLKREQMVDDFQTQGGQIDRAGVGQFEVEQRLLGGQDGLDVARGDDTLVVWRLDRLGRSLKDLIRHVETMEERKISLRSLQESIDTTTSGGRLFFHIFGALAEFERNLIRERTMAGLTAARAEADPVFLDTDL